jgi:hypothetical protein
VDDAASKIQYALPMLLGALAHLPHRKEWRLQITASIHDCDNLKEKLIEALSGEHECILSGYASKVCVRVVKVLPEGMGALVGEQLPGKLTLLDFGTGTTLFSRYSQGKVAGLLLIPSCFNLTLGLCQFINYFNMEVTLPPMLPGVSTAD